eukprot:XP_011683745.1 PREDICTED: uncharacterized protein LOC100892408 isoform X2 [Strongylocentrotus purpuratus]
MMLWSIHRIQCVLTLVITVKLRCSYAEFTCYFGKNGRWAWSNDLTKCGITQASSPGAWGAVSGRGSNGNAPQGGANDGFLLTTGGGESMKIQAIFQLPNLNLQHNSGLLSFHYKFFDSGESSLTISVCGLMIDDVNLQSNGNWELVENIRIYCNGNNPTVTFNATWSISSGRVAVDNIRVVSTPPPTTTTKATTTTTFKSSTSTKRTMNTTKHRTNTTEHTTTSVATSEWTRSSPRSTGSDSTTPAVVDISFTEPLVSNPSRLEAKNKSRIVVAISVTVVVIIIVIVLLAVIIKRRKSSSKVIREGQEITMTRSLNHNTENHYGIDNQTAMSSTYDTISEGVNPVQQSDQASNGDYGTEEMVVNILYQSVDKDDMIPSAIGGANPVQQSDQASSGDYGTEEMVVNILYQSVDKDDFHMIPSVI